MASRFTAHRHLIVIAAVIVFALGLRVMQHFDERKVVRAEVTVAGHVFHAEVADTPAKRELGLGKRDALAPDDAMYFPMGMTTRWIFWMKDMRFPIDIVWIAEGKVVGVSANAQPPKPGEEPATLSPVVPADAVLEISAGMAANIGLKAGDEVSLTVLP